MRKDVRTGAAIGAILLAVVIVWAIFASKGHNNKKDQVALDPNTLKPNNPAGESTGGADRPADAVTGARDDRPDPLTALTHEPLPGTGGSGVAAPTPSHVDDSAPTPAPASPTPEAPVGRPNWGALLSADAPVLTHTPDPDRSATGASTPGASDSPAPVGVIDAVNRSSNTRLIESPVPTADNTVSHSTIRTSSPDSRLATTASALTTGAASHRVASGETFSSIARAAYGDARYFKDIIKANPRIDPTRLRPGMAISLPDRSQVVKHATAAPQALSAATSSEVRHHAVAPATLNPSTEYRVQGSDNLYKISMKLYHSPNKVDAIYQLNKELIGSDPGRLKLNMVLKLPEPPVATASR